MGGDGGQVIDRATMVRTKGHGFTKDNGNGYAASLGEMANFTQMQFEDRGLGTLERHRTRMSQCWLSQDTLCEPVVVCRLGNMYNKEAFIGALLNKKLPSRLSHLRALKDVKQCTLSWATEEGERRMVCPVTREILDTGGSRAVLIWPSGVVVSAKTLAELKTKECPVTGTAFDKEKDVITLAPNEEELQRLTDKLPAQTKKRMAAAVESASAVAAAAAAPRPSQQLGAQAQPSAKRGKTAGEGVFQENAAKSETYKKMFQPDLGDGMTGTRDAMGTPCYPRGPKVYY